VLADSAHLAAISLSSSCRIICSPSPCKAMRRASCMSTSIRTCRARSLVATPDLTSTRTHVFFFIKGCAVTTAKIKYRSSTHVEDCSSHSTPGNARTRDLYKVEVALFARPRPGRRPGQEQKARPRPKEDEGLRGEGTKKEKLIATTAHILSDGR
jgi:hypothetical protein